MERGWGEARVGGYPSGNIFLYGDYFFTEFIVGGLVGFQANVVLDVDNIMIVCNGRLVSWQCGVSDMHWFSFSSVFSLGLAFVFAFVGQLNTHNCHFSVMLCVSLLIVMYFLYYLFGLYIIK